MKHESREDAERAIMEQMLRLDAEQIAQVLDFVEFLAEKKRDISPVVELLRESATGPRISLDDVRASLATIKGQLSDVVREERDERG
jgi:hypothetical protein